MKDKTFQCVDCKNTHESWGPLVGSLSISNFTLNPDGKVCPACQGVRDEKRMNETGRFTLYLITENNQHKVTNFAGTLEFPAVVRHSKCLLYGQKVDRNDVWIEDKAGKVWYGRNMGDNQVVSLKRTKHGKMPQN